MFLLNVSLILVSIVITYSSAEVQCEPSRKPYTVEHEEYCDKYYLCTKGQPVQEMSCEDGLVFDSALDKCDLPHSVQCENRTKLQPPQNPSTNCPRLNGMFPLPNSCDKFTHCTDGKHTLITCATGLTFQPSVGACVHADSVHDRPDCSASKVLDFSCPSSILNGQQPMRFGDHERFPHPNSCKLFYMCLLSGFPRLGGCGDGLAFNPETGFCDQAENIPGCEHLGEGKTSTEKVAPVENNTTTTVLAPSRSRTMGRKRVILKSTIAEEEDIE